MKPKAPTRLTDPVSATTAPVCTPSEFLTTRWTMVTAAGQTDSPASRLALEDLCRTYWRPLYGFARRWGLTTDEAQDATQEFFSRFLTAGSLQGVDREKGRFRSYLSASMKHFLMNRRAEQNAVKRGGGIQFFEFDAAEELFRLEAPGPTPESIFDRRWATEVMERGFLRLQSEAEASGKGAQFTVLKTFLSQEAEKGDYEMLGRTLGMKANAVAVAVHRMRLRYGQHVRDEVADTVASEEDIEDEIAYLIQVLAED